LALFWVGVNNYRSSWEKFKSIEGLAPSWIALAGRVNAGSEDDRAGTDNRSVDQLLSLALSDDLESRISIEVESYFLFVTMALDRAAVLTDSYLGPASTSWKTFSNFKYLRELAEKCHRAQPPAALLSSITWLTDQVIRFRHEDLVHKQEGPDRPRHVLGITFNPLSLEISAGYRGIIDPRPGENVLDEVSVREVLSHMHDFLDQLLTYLEITSAEATSSLSSD
jgi:hypothetical protein